MAQTQQTKTYYSFIGGLNTEVSELLFPDNSSQAEENFELLTNGSRRRRKGLEFEKDHVLFPREMPQFSDAAARNPAGIAYTEYSWRAVNGNGNRNFIVQQIGPELRFFEDNRDSYSDKLKSFYVFLNDYQTSFGGQASTTFRMMPVQFAAGRGDLLVVGEQIDPLRITYNPQSDDITVTRVPLRQRDFLDADNSTEVYETKSTLPNVYLYDLLNRGWSSTLIGDFHSALSAYPAKNMIPWKGLQRSVLDTDVNQDDGIKEFSPDKLVAEYVGDLSAPKGRFITNVFNNNEIFGSGADDVLVNLAISTWTISDTSIVNPIVTVTTASDHGLVANDFVDITGQASSWQISGGAFFVWSFNGEYEIISVPASDQFTIQVDFFPSQNGFNNWSQQYAALGQIKGTFSRATEDQIRTDLRTKCVAFYAGRAWYAGCPVDKLANKLFFSQIVEDRSQYGKCYQEADPTDERIPDLVETDGGVITIPEMGQVTRMVPFEESLLVFTEDGIWEISGGFREYFSALNYQVRKLSDSKIYAAQGITKSEDRLFYAAGDGLHVIRLDPQAGILIDENISEERVQSLWMSMPGSNWDKVKAHYDPVRKRVWWLWNNQPNSRFVYNQALIFDLRLLAYFKYRFHQGSTENSVGGGLYITGISSPRFFCCTNEPVIKFTTVSVTPTLSGTFTYSELLDNEGWADWTDFDVPAFLVTGPELMEDAGKTKQAPVITTFMKRTETGFEEVDGDLVPKNESSCLMRSRWDWADNEESGKWGVQKQIYKHRRYWQPNDVADPFDNGHPVVVVREKIFGSGRALQLEFRSEPGKPAEILGWSVDYLGNPVP